MKADFFREIYQKKFIILKRAVCLLAVLLACRFYRCPIRWLFQADCPGCGMTRAILAAVRLDFKAAFQYHSLFPLVIAGSIYFVFREPFRKSLSITHKQEQGALVLCGMLFLIRWLIHLFL